MAIAKDKFDKASTKYQVYSDFLNVPAIPDDEVDLGGLDV